MDAFRDAWNKLKGIVASTGVSVDTHNARALTTLVNQPLPQVSYTTLIDAFNNTLIGNARTILREQILRAREILDTPSQPLGYLNKREAILKTFDTYENRMRFVSTNELLQLNADINKSRQSQAGIREYVWTTCLDDRVRPRHQMLEGTVQQWAAAPSPGYHPGEDWNCRCGAFPVLDDTYALVATVGTGL